MNKKIKTSLLLLVAISILLTSVILVSCNKKPKKEEIIDFSFVISNSGIENSLTISDKDFKTLNSEKIKAKVSYKFANKEKTQTLELMALPFKSLIEYRANGMNKSLPLRNELLDPNKMIILNPFGEVKEYSKKEIANYKNMYIAYAYKSNKKFIPLKYNKDLNSTLLLVKDSNVESIGIRGIYLNTNVEDIKSTILYSDKLLNEDLNNKKINGKNAFDSKTVVRYGNTFNYYKYQSMFINEQLPIKTYKSYDIKIGSGNIDPSSLSSLKGEIKAISLYDYIDFVAPNNYIVPETVKITYSGFSENTSKKIKNEKYVNTQNVILYYEVDKYSISKKINIMLLEKNPENGAFNKILATKCYNLLIEK